MNSDMGNDPTVEGRELSSVSSFVVCDARQGQQRGGARYDRKRRMETIR